VHNQVKKEAIAMLLNTAKYVWKDNKTELHYILDDATRAFITLSEDFFYEDYDIFVEDTTKNQQQIEALRNLMQPAMQNGASLLDIAEIITMDNVTMIKGKLEEIEQKRMEQQQAMEEAQAQREQQMIQMQNEVKEEELMIKEAEMDLEKYKIDSDNATKITVAQLNAYRGVEDMD
jgi:DNA repair exonuclease SbcCD ATPase subunit